MKKKRFQIARSKEGLKKGMVVVIVLVVDGWNFFLSFLPLNGFVVDNYPLGMKFGKLKIQDLHA